jgi:putative hydrolase of the HAD superfamily
LKAFTRRAKASPVDQNETGLTGAVRGIIFDLDGTLYHMRWFMKPLLTLRLMPHFMRLPRYMVIRGRHAGVDFGSGEALLHRLAADLAGGEDHPALRRCHDWILNRFYRAFAEIMPLLRGSRPGLVDTLSRLRARGVRLGVLSDFDWVYPRLQRLGVDPSLFDTLSSSESSGCLKPSARSFHAIAAEWNLPYHEILVVGDRLDTDGTGAAAAGMQFLRISDNAARGGLCWPALKAILEQLPETGRGKAHSASGGA